MVSSPPHRRNKHLVLGFGELGGLGASLLGGVVGLVGLDNGKGVAAEDVDVGALELAGRDPVLEEDVELAVGAALGLGKTEVDPDNAEEAGTGPEEARVSCMNVSECSMANRSEQDLPPQFQAVGVSM